MRKTKIKKRVQVASRISDALKKSLDMWSHSQRVSNSEAIRIALERLVLPETQKDEITMRLDQMEGVLMLIMKDVKSFGVMRHDIELVGELVVSSMMVSDYYNKKDEIGEPAAKEDNRKRYNSFVKLTHERHKKGAIFEDLEKEKRKPL